MRGWSLKGVPDSALVCQKPQPLPNGKGTKRPSKSCSAMTPEAWAGGDSSLTHKGRCAPVSDRRQERTTASGWGAEVNWVFAWTSVWTSNCRTRSTVRACTQPSNGYRLWRCQGLEICDKQQQKESFFSTCRSASAHRWSVLRAGEEEQTLLGWCQTQWSQNQISALTESRERRQLETPSCRRRKHPSAKKVGVLWGLLHTRWSNPGHWRRT